VHLAILTPSLPGTTFAAKELNCRVRDGIGCFLFAIDTPKPVFNISFVYVVSFLLSSVYVFKYVSLFDQSLPSLQRKS
jgi:hypothetical protein